MRNCIILIGIFLTTIFGLHGCGGSDGEDYVVNNNEKPMISESYLAMDPSASVTEEQTLLLYLEHPTSSAEEGDLENVGNDCYTFNPTEDIEAELVIDPKMPISLMEITDLRSPGYLSLTKEDAGTLYSFKGGGSYKICIYHDGEAENSQMVTINFSGSGSNSAPVTMVTSSDFSERDFSRCLIKPEGVTMCSVAGNNSSGPFTFFNCDLTGADFTDAKVYVDTAYGIFNNIKVNSGTQFNLNQRTVLHMQLENVDVTSAGKFDLPDDIKAMSFKNSTLKDKITFKAGISIIDHVNFEGADLSNVQMMDINFHNVNLKNAILKQAHLIDSQFTDNVKLNGTDFTDAFLNNADFSGSRLENANFSGATLYGTTFDFVTIDKCTFKDCKTNEHTSVTYSELTNMDLEQLSFLAKTYVDMSNTTQDTIKWSFSGMPPGYSCSTHWYETSNTYSNCDWDEDHGHIGGGEDPGCKDAKYWEDNYFCSKEDLHFVFDNAGWYDGEHIRLHETSDRSWDDNYLSYISKHSINFHWKSNGKMAEKLCVNVQEPSDASNTWWDNYVCFDFD